VLRTVAIGNPERHVRKALHRGFKRGKFPALKEAANSNGSKQQ